MNKIRRQRWFRSTFESLEDRRLLTTFNVTTTIDRLDTADVTLAHPKGLDGKLSLREAIYLANLHGGPDTVVLKANSTYKITIAGAGEDADATGDFDVTDDLTIKGSGSKSIINGNGLDRVLDIPVDGISLTLDHVVVTGGIARGGGGGLQAADNETLTLTNSSVIGNISTSPGGGFGGGISLASGNINLTNSHVDGNSAAAGTSGAGGGIYVGNGSGFITITNSTVNGNSAYNSGGGIQSYLTDPFTIVNSQINNNHAGTGDGGGVLLANNETFVTITGSTFSGDTAGDEGGALSQDIDSPVTITKSTFSNNSSADDGGAVWTNGGLLYITSSTFANNSSTGGSGGAVANAGAVQVTDSVFNHNVAQGFGGAIRQGTEGGITILRSTFTKNASLTDEGGAIVAFGDLSDTVTVTLSNFTFNIALDNSGAIFSNGEEIIIDRSTFDHNTSVNGEGGAIFYAPVEATDSTFSYNTAKADGGAVDSDGQSMSFVRCVFSHNTATNGEGGGFTDGNNSVLTDITVEDCTFDGNTAGGDGGGFTVTGAQVTMTGSTLSNNRSGSDGGGAYIITSGLDSDSAGSSIINCTISGNGAADAGGGIDFEGDGDLTIINATIVFNATDHGGGIAQTDGAGTIHIGNTIVAKNIANTGPDIYDTQAAFDDLGHNLFFSLLGQGNAGIPSGSPINSNNDIIGLDPKLGPLVNNGGQTKTHALLKGSPAINAGDDSLAPPTDQRGVKRPQGPHVDIGAYEKQ